MGGVAGGFMSLQTEHYSVMRRRGLIASRLHLIAHLQSWLCVPAWRWCPRCIPSGWGTCLASWGCSGSRWGCGSCAHTQLDTNAERDTESTHIGRMLISWLYRKRSEEMAKGTGRRETREPKESERILKKHVLVRSSEGVSHESMHASTAQPLWKRR